MRHHPLAELLSAFIVADLTIEHVAELGERPSPPSWPSAPASADSTSEWPGPSAERRSPGQGD
jgi:hypothetical protein